MMKKASVKIILAAVLCLSAMWVSGCSQQGETTAEGNRRHIRNVRINQEQLNEDLDAVFMADKPSNLSEMRVP